jgi:hypothetical protein
MPGDRNLKFPPLKRKNFKKLLQSVIYANHNIVIHGTYHGGKTSLLLEMESKSQAEGGTKTCVLRLNELGPYRSRDRGDKTGFYSYVSVKLFGECLPVNDIHERVLSQYRLQPLSYRMALRVGSKSLGVR